MLVGLCILFSACSDQEENERLLNNTFGEDNTVDVNFSLSFIPTMNIQGNTDYRPMSTRAEGTIESLLSNEYYCLVMKEIDNIWYVDTLVKKNLTEGSRWDVVEVRDTLATNFQDLQLTLRPGHYRLLVVLNPTAGLWNPALVPGAVVKNGTDTVACAYTYKFQQDPYFANLGKREVSKDMFAGITEFTIKKTSDLHSDPVNGNTHITFYRKVMQMRFLLKDNPSPQNQFNFKDTQHTVSATLKATQPDKPFCDGLDCWGDAYYNHQQPTTEIEICTDLDPNWRDSKINTRYKMYSSHATVRSPFIYTDETSTVPYEVNNLKVFGQSGQGGFVYIYTEPIQNLILINNTIQQWVFQTTDQVDGEIVAPQLQVTLEYLKEESSLDLFPTNFEYNIP